jgi:predicted nucleic acid-binding protein
LIVYFETSSFLKLFLAEPDAQVAQDVWNEADSIITSEITYTEARAGLARASFVENPPRLVAAEYPNARRRLEALWSQTTTMAVTNGLIREAGDLAELHKLKAYDAVHFASVLSLDEPQLIFATRDEELERAARAEEITLSMLSPAPGP